MITYFISLRLYRLSFSAATFNTFRSVPTSNVKASFLAIIRVMGSSPSWIFTTDLSRSSICMILFCKSALTHNASANFIFFNFIDSATKLAATYAKPQHMQKDLNLIRTIFK